MSAAATLSIAAGTRLPVLERHVTQATIDAYARASGDFNPIHVDPAFAAKGPFGRTIAHGLMTLAFVAELLNGWSDGAFDASGELDIAFIGPVFAGDTVSIGGTVEALEPAPAGPSHAIVRLEGHAGGRPIVGGTAKVPVTIDGGTQA